MRDPEASLGQSIPPDTPHAVSVSLPTWRSNVGYEEGQEWVVSKMTTGYPRFVINAKIKELSDAIVEKYASRGDQALIFPSASAARRCVDFMHANLSPEAHSKLNVVEFHCFTCSYSSGISPYVEIAAVIFPSTHFKIAKTFWQHTGEGISSRRAEYCKMLLDHGDLAPKTIPEKSDNRPKGPKRYRTSDFHSNTEKHESHTSSDLNGKNTVLDNGDYVDRARYLEERFGRNLNLELAEEAKIAIKRRIMGSLSRNEVLPDSLSAPVDKSRVRDLSLDQDDVYLYSCGMSSIWNTHRMIRLAKGEGKSICFGFSYLDTLKVLQKFGPGCLFYAQGSDTDLNDLEDRLKAGERYIALFCEFPSNPLLRSPNMKRIRQLADEFGFAVVVDETIGNFLNVNVLPFTDVLVSSLTKIFSGDSNVMGGSAILNPRGNFYQILKKVWSDNFEDNIWPEDVIFLERNSRDYASRIIRINQNAEAICRCLSAHPRIKKVYYPLTSDTKEHYDALRTPEGGYGGLLSATFYSTKEAEAFYDALATEKGPSLGTNFTLVSPFVLLAHYTELEWAAEQGVEKDLLRFSVGLENTDQLVTSLEIAFRALEEAAAA